MPPGCLAPALLAALSVPDRARVLEGLHAGPAARIAGHLDARGHAAPAVELMDILMAAKMLRSMDPLAAARLLEAMDPAAAAARITGSHLAQLLTAMTVPAAGAVLQAMTPETAGERLEAVRPVKAAAAILQPMNPDVSIGILAAMPGWGPKSILLEMPPDIAEPLLTRLRQDPVANRRWDLDFNRPR